MKKPLSILLCATMTLGALPATSPADVNIELVVEKALATILAAAPQASVRLAKQSLRAGLSRTLAQCLAAETEAQAQCWASPDSDEGVRAFVEKRKAAFGAAQETAPAAHRFE